MGNKNAIPGQPPGSQPSAQWAPGVELMAAIPVSGTTVYTTTTQAIANKDNVGLQIEFAGTMTGTLEVLCSINNVKFDPLTFDPLLSQPAGSNLSYLIDLNQVPFPYLQVQYTNASGSGTLTVFFSVKDLN